MTISLDPPRSSGAPSDRMATRELLVVAIRLEAEDVISIHLEAPPGSAPLEPWEPGAHLELRLPGGMVRQYSLFGDPATTTRYAIAVLRDPRSRGGSAHLHDTALVGRRIEVRGPRNKFELEPAASYVFVAGGIGITPITAMAREATRNGVPWVLHYGGRTRRHMSLVQALEQFADPEQLHLVPQDEDGFLDLADIVATTPPDGQIYACGPESLLKALEQTASAATPPRQLHTERFGAAAPEPAGGESPSNESFEVELRRTGVSIVVPADRSILEVVREHVPDAPASCEEGFCGSCECRVLEGVPDHRDDVLSPEEKAENETMIPCVSRAISSRLVLDL